MRHNSPQCDSVVVVVFAVATHPHVRTNHPRLAWRSLSLADVFHSPNMAHSFSTALPASCFAAPWCFQPETIKSLAEATGFPVGDEVVSRVSTYLKKADGKTLEGLVDLGEIAAGVYRRLSQLTLIISRGTAIAGLWLIWVWLKVCFAPVVVKTAKA